MKDKILDFCKKIVKMPEFYFCLTMIVINIIFTADLIGADNIMISGPIELLFEIGLILCVWRMRKKKVGEEKIFLVLALVLGSLFLVLVPAWQVPDESTHFKRAYGISDGYFMPYQVDDKGNVGSPIPSEILRDYSEEPRPGTYGNIIKNFGDGDLNEVEEMSYSNAAVYNFVCYLPQIVAALIGKLFHFSALGILYLMRFFNFAFWVVLVYFAIKLIPKFKTTMMFIALLPITLQEAASASSDAMTIGISLFLIGYALYLSYGKKKKLSKKDYVLISVVSLVASLCKIVYLPLALLFMMIPKEMFGGAKRKWWFLGSLAAVVVIINLGWLMMSSGLLVTSQPGTDPHAQLLGILSNPVRYLSIIIRSISVKGDFWMRTMFGMSLGFLKISVPDIFFFISVVVMIMLFVQDNGTMKLRTVDRIIIGTVGVVIFGLICTSLYMQWTAYGSLVVDGIQGRYFLPILILVPIAACGKKKKVSTELISKNAASYYSIFLDVIALVAIIAVNI